jgi:hypothetical protein
MIQSLIHYPAADFIAVLSLVALIVVFDRLGLIAWILSLDHRKGKQRDKAADDYWNIHG